MPGDWRTITQTSGLPDAAINIPEEPEPRILGLRPQAKLGYLFIRHWAPAQRASVAPDARKANNDSVSIRFPLGRRAAGERPFASIGANRISLHRRGARFARRGWSYAC